MEDSNSQNLDIFIVCGLGSLGQHCALSLKRFGVKIIAIELSPPNNWEIGKIPTILDELITGDCRNINILREAKIDKCRAALVVTNNELVNVETAIAIRQLNPKTRIVVRSKRKNLDRLLSERINNFIAFDPFELPTLAFALAALGDDILGFFNIDGQWLRAVSYSVKEGDNWCNSRTIEELNSRSLQVLTHHRQATPSYPLLQEWDGDEVILAEDVLITIELADRFALNVTEEFDRGTRQRRKFKLSRFLREFYRRGRDRITKFSKLGFQDQIRRVAAISFLIVLFLLFLGAILFKLYRNDLSFLSGLKTALVLLNGGYSDVFGGLLEPDSLVLPWWLDSISLILDLSGTLFLGILYAWLTEELLSFKFDIVRNRPAIPEKNHVVVIGLGRLGQKVVNLLQDYKQSILAASFNANLDRNILPDIPLIVGNIKEVLAKANLNKAKSAIVVTDNEMENLEVALMIKSVNPETHLAIRTYGRKLSQYLNELLPKVQAICTYEEVSKAFAGSAFGENIIYLFRIKRRTIIVAEYYIETGDTLAGLLLSDLAYGYGVVSILYQRSGRDRIWMPSEDLRLNNEDRLIVLATTDGLRRIELGQLNFSRKSYRVLIEKVASQEAEFEAANTIDRVTNCGLNLAREVMKNIPQTLSVPLYKQQAKRLVKELSKAMVKARIIES